MDIIAHSTPTLNISPPPTSASNIPPPPTTPRRPTLAQLLAKNVGIVPTPTTPSNPTMPPNLEESSLLITSRRMLQIADALAELLTPSAGDDDDAGEPHIITSAKRSNF